MKKYILTSEKFEGRILLWYMAEGALVHYTNEAGITFGQHCWILKRLPLLEEHLADFVKSLPGSHLEELPHDISFEAFYNAYGKKRNAVRCKPLYEALSAADKLKTIMSIKPYYEFLKRTGWRSACDPDTYLRQRYFDTDWTKEQ